MRENKEENRKKKEGEEDNIKKRKTRR